MSSFKNAIKNQKTHRERHQPEQRQNLGFLEKKKDYKLRAQDFNEKQKTLQLLRKKAQNKNPDEFYYHMINSKTVDGEHKEKSKEATLTPEQVALMQTQDLNYIISKRTSEKRKLAKLQSKLHLISSDDKPANKHTFFVDTEKEKRSLDIAERLDTHPSLLGRTHNRPRMSDLKKGKFSSSLNADQMREVKKDTMKAYKELEQRIGREGHLSVLQRKMEIRAIMRGGKNKPAKVLREETKDAPPIYAWPKERQK